MRKMTIVIVYDDVFARDRALKALMARAVNDPLQGSPVGVLAAMTDMGAGDLRRILMTGQGRFDPYVRDAESALLIGADTEAQDLLCDVAAAAEQLESKGDHLEILTLSEAIVQKRAETGAKELTLKRPPTYGVDRHIYQHLGKANTMADYTFIEGQDELDMYAEMAWSWMRRKAATAPAE